MEQEGLSDWAAIILNLIRLFYLKVKVTICSVHAPHQYYEEENFNKSGFCIYYAAARFCRLFPIVLLTEIVRFFFQVVP